MLHSGTLLGLLLTMTGYIFSDFSYWGKQNFFFISRVALLGGPMDKYVFLLSFSVVSFN